MNLPEYLGSKALKTRIDYEWTRLIGNKFFAVPGEKYPKLWDALDGISVRAAFALGVACSEWAVARLQYHADVSDTLLRIEAAWAATLDWRYANLTEPQTPKVPNGPDPIAEPLWQVRLFLTSMHEGYIKTYSKVPNKAVVNDSLCLALLSKHILPKKAGFDKWLNAAFQQARKRYPARKEAIEKPVPPGFFYPGFQWDEKKITESQEQLLTMLNPKSNPYLQKPAQMKEHGFKGEPYRSS